MAAELERSAARAQARGGIAAAAGFLATAATLTPDPAERSRRLIAAARAKRDAGALDEALQLLSAAAGRCRPCRPRRPSTCGGGSPSTTAAWATPRGCCSTRPRAWSRSTPNAPARCSSRRSEPRSGPLTTACSGRRGPRCAARAWRRHAVDLVLDALAPRLRGYGCCAGHARCAGHRARAAGSRSRSRPLALADRAPRDRAARARPLGPRRLARARLAPGARRPRGRRARAAAVRAQLLRDLSADVR